MIKVGSRVWVRASRALGSPRTRATVHSVDHLPGEIPQYPDGLLTVRCDDESPESLAYPPGVNIDFKGYCYIGPPFDGFLVQAP